MRTDEPGLPVTTFGLQLAVGLALRAAIALGGGLRLPLGGDAPYWAQRALELGSGVYLGSHPPLYPVTGLAVAAVTRLDVGIALAAVAALAGALVAPVFGAAVGAAAGRRAGTLAGWLLTTLPALTFASVRIEPTSFVALLAAVALWASVRAVRDGGWRWPLAAGLAAGFAAVAKENGLLAAAALGVGLALGAPRRWLASACFLLAASPALVAQHQLDAAFERRTGIERTKLELPLAEALALVEAGTIPHALREMQADPASSDPGMLERIAAASSPVERGVLFGRLQLARLFRGLGPWAVLIPAACALLLRRARGEPALRPVLALSLALLPCLLVVVQPRHMEVGALGGLGCVAVVAASRRWWTLAAAGLAVAHGAWRTSRIEWEELDRARRCAESEHAVTQALDEQLGPEGAACATAAWFGLRTGALVPRCMLEDVRIGEEQAFVVDRDSMQPIRERADLLGLRLRCGEPAHAGCVANTAVCRVSNVGLGPTGLRWGW